MREWEAAKDQGECKEEATFVQREQGNTVGRSLLLWVKNLICAMGLYVLLKQNALEAKVKPPEENGLKLSD